MNSYTKHGRSYMEKLLQRFSLLFFFSQISWAFFVALFYYTCTSNGDTANTKPLNLFIVCSCDFTARVHHSNIIKCISGQKFENVGASPFLNKSMLPGPYKSFKL